MPDFYQGTELWDFRLADPDNRGTVDFDLRIGYLHAMKAREAAIGTAGLARELALPAASAFSIFPVALLEMTG